MVNKPFYIILIIIVFSMNFLFGQKKTREQQMQSGDEYFNPNYFRYDNHAYSENVKTVQLHHANNILAPPVFAIGATEQLMLRFDVLGHAFTQYTYTLVRCTWDWFPADMPELEYISGYTQDYIYDYAFSVNTQVPYTHYKLLFPTENMQPRLSGNYVLIVFEENKEKPILTHRFSVSEESASIQERIHQATIVEFMDFKQEVDFTLFLGGQQVNDPYNEIKPVIIQNNRSDNQVTGLKPVFIKGKELVYDHERNNLFWGGNEFRAINITNLKNFYTYTDKILQDDSGIYHVQLKPQPSRSYMRYTNNPDINGQFAINYENALRNAHAEADYVYVHFALQADFPVYKGQVYVFGALSNWQASGEFRMKYNYEKQQYECTVLLKQGYYDYLFGVLEDGKTEIDVSYFEGSHWQTQNQYQLFIYHVPAFDKTRYRLIAYIAK